MRKRELEGFIAGYQDVITGLLTTHDLPTKRWLRGYDAGRARAERHLDPFGRGRRPGGRRAVPADEVRGILSEGME